MALAKSGEDLLGEHTVSSKMNSSVVLPDSADDCAELYFELDSPAERDVFVRQLATRHDTSTEHLLRTIFLSDSDPFVRLIAADHLARQNDVDAIAWLREILAISDDDDLLAEAIDVWLALPVAKQAAEVGAIISDRDRSSRQRVLAAAALVRHDPLRAATYLVGELKDCPPADLDVDLLSQFVAAWRTEPAALPQAISMLAEHQRALKALLEAVNDEEAQLTERPSEIIEEQLQDRRDDLLERLLGVEEGLAELSLPPLAYTVGRST